MLGRLIFKVAAAFSWSRLTYWKFMHIQFWPTTSLVFNILISGFMHDLNNITWYSALYIIKLDSLYCTINPTALNQSFQTYSNWTLSTLVSLIPISSDPFIGQHIFMVRPWTILYSVSWLVSWLVSTPISKQANARPRIGQNWRHFCRVNVLRHFSPNSPKPAYDWNMYWG